MTMANETGEELDLGLWAPTKARQSLGRGGQPKISWTRCGDRERSHGQWLFLDLHKDPAPGLVFSLCELCHPGSLRQVSCPPEGVEKTLGSDACSGRKRCVVWASSLPTCKMGLPLRPFPARLAMCSCL